MAMLGNEFARYLRACGRRVEVACGVHWASFRPGSRSYFSLPDQVEVPEDDAEVGAMLRRVGGLQARYATLGPRGVPSGVYILPLAGYRLESLERKTRHSIRRGLEACEIRPLTARELRVDALRLNRDTIARQQRQAPEFSDEREWAKLAGYILDHPALRVTGAFVEGELASYTIDCHEDGWIYGLHQFSRDDLRQHRTNHALEFAVGLQAAEEGVAVAMTNGMPALRTDAGLHHFKLKMGYQVVPRRLTMRLHPAIHGLAASRAGLAGLRALGRLGKYGSIPALAASLLGGGEFSPPEDDHSSSSEISK